MTTQLPIHRSPDTNKTYFTVSSLLLRNPDCLVRVYDHSASCVNSLCPRDWSELHIGEWNVAMTFHHLHSESTIVPRPEKSFPELVREQRGQGRIEIMWRKYKRFFTCRSTKAYPPADSRSSFFPFPIPGCHVGQAWTRVTGHHYVRRAEE